MTAEKLLLSYLFIMAGNLHNNTSTGRDDVTIFVVMRHYKKWVDVSLTRQ